MLKETIYVPQDKCPLDVLAEMGAETVDAWIFLHKNVIDKLLRTANHIGGHPGNMQLTWNATEKYPRTVLAYGISSPTWYNVKSIEASDIAFQKTPSNPINIFFLEMGT